MKYNYLFTILLFATCIFCASAQAPKMEIEDTDFKSIGDGSVKIYKNGLLGGGGSISAYFNNTGLKTGGFTYSYGSMTEILFGGNTGIYGTVTGVGISGFGVLGGYGPDLQNPVRYTGLGTPTHAIRIVDGNEGAGKVLTSDASGNGAWADSPGTYKIGDFAMGGIVFWVDDTGRHGLVCAKNDQHAGIRWWHGGYINSFARGDAPMAGEMNTSIIVAVHTSGILDIMPYAALICASLAITEGGKSYGDWYLPSRAELNAMAANRGIINATAMANGGSAFSTEDSYWSSTEEDIFNASVVHLNTGLPDADKLKLNLHRVRAVRKF